jgi:predicted nucleic acid-binding Zn ribbon protein
MDKADTAQEQEDKLLEITLKNIREKVKRSLIPSGYCYYCQEEIPPPLIFCNLECRDDYCKEQRLKRITGR